MLRYKDQTLYFACLDLPNYPQFSLSYIILARLATVYAIREIRTFMRSVSWVTKCVRSATNYLFFIRPDKWLWDFAAGR